jgi:hypothetical protein
MSTEQPLVQSGKVEAGIRPSFTAPVSRHQLAAGDILHLAELVPMVRERFALPPAFGDDAILSSLRTIAAQSEPRERWRVAFSSNLGQTLARGGRDLNTALNALLALLPKALS